MTPSDCVSLLCTSTKVVGQVRNATLHLLMLAETLSSVCGNNVMRLRFECPCNIAVDFVGAFLEKQKNYTAKVSKHLC